MKELLWLFCSWQGRLDRKHYWLASLMIVVGSLSPLLLRILNIHIFEWIDAKLWFQTYFLVMLGPLISLQVKRWHDRNRPAWFLLLNLVPVIGSIAVFVGTYCLPGDSHTNRYGSNPAENQDDNELAYSIEVALQMLDPYVENRQPFALSLQKQLHWCQLNLTGFETGRPPAPLNLTGIANNTFDPWQKPEALLTHLEKIQQAMEARVLDKLEQRSGTTNTFTDQEYP